MLGQLPSFTQMGTVAKMMRWLSIGEVHEFFSTEYPALKMILEQMVDVLEGDGPQHNDLIESVIDAAQTASTAAAVDDAESLRNSLKSSGKLKTAYNAITVENVDLIDTFVVACRADQCDYSHLTSQVKTPQDGIDHRIGEAKNPWAYFYRVASMSVLDVDQVKRVHAHLAGPRGETQARGLMAMILWIAKCRGEWIQVP